MFDLKSYGLIMSIMSFLLLSFSQATPLYALVDNTAKKTHLSLDLIQSVPGEQIQLVSSTLDANKSIVYEHSDINPGTYYLFRG